MDNFQLCESEHSNTSEGSSAYQRLHQDAPLPKNGEEELNSTVPDAPPSDSNNLVLWSFFAIGLIILLPWNILITVTGYWDYKFRNVSEDGEARNSTEEDLTQFQKEFQSYLSIAANVPNATFVILHALFGHKFNMKMRLPLSQLGQILVLLVIVVLAPIDSDSWQHAFLVINLSAIALLNVFSAVFQGSAFANVGPFPVSYMGYLNIGTGVGGIVPTLVSIIILSINPDFQMAGFWCFLWADLMAVGCLLLTIYFMKSPFYNFYTTRVDSRPALNLRQDIDQYKTIFRLSWIYMASVFINFTTNIAVFPGVTALIRPSDPTVSTDWTDIYFETVLCFLAYNVGDSLGKALANWIQWPNVSKIDQWILLTATILRIGFVPLFMFCNVAPNNRDSEVIFESEYYYLAFMLAFSISGGYLANISVMFGPKVVQEDYQEMTASFLIAFLVVGCGIGSVLSTPLVRAL